MNYAEESYGENAQQVGFYQVDMDQDSRQQNYEHLGKGDINVAEYDDQPVSVINYFQHPNDQHSGKFERNEG